MNHTAQALVRVLVIAGAITLASCGGGGGDTADVKPFGTGTTSGTTGGTGTGTSGTGTGAGGRGAPAPTPPAATAGPAGLRVAPADPADGAPATRAPIRPR